MKRSKFSAISINIFHSNNYESKISFKVPNLANSEVFHAFLSPLEVLRIRRKKKEYKKEEGTTFRLVRDVGSVTNGSPGGLCFCRTSNLIRQVTDTTDSD